MLEGEFQASVKLTYKTSSQTTTDIAGQVNPKLVYDPCDNDIPIAQVYGKMKPTPEILKNSDLLQLVSEWVAKFSKVLEDISESPTASNINELDTIFAPHSFWKDHLCLSWDFHQYSDLGQIKDFLSKQIPYFQLQNFQINRTADLRYDNSISIATIQDSTGEQPIPIQLVQFIVNFDNCYGKGSGVIRLIPVDNKLIAYSVYTGLESIKGNEEQLGFNRPEGDNHGQHKARTSWLENRENDFIWGESSKQPTVLVVGGGQSGLNIAARLKCMGVDTLIVEKNPNIGDNWRNRYKFLVLHDPVWADHLAYMNFPDTWPIFTPKDKLGDWFENYAKNMELSFWANKTVVGADFEEDKSTWIVKVIDNDSGKMDTLRPKHVIMATGHSGEPNIPSFEDQHKFKGKIVHSSQHSTGKMYQGENALVVGCCNSGHDIAQDFYEQGAKPILIQRSSTCIFTAEVGGEITNEGLYEEGGPPIDTADLLSQSMPWKLLNLTLQQQTRRIASLEKELHDSLKNVGFNIDYGYGGTGLPGKYSRRGGGYYIDVGCSRLIAERKILVKNGQSIHKFTEDGVVFSDGSTIGNVAIVVLATGYSNMKESARKIFGSTVADRLNPVWGLDDEGETKVMYRDSGHPNFWYMGGNLLLTRYFSKKLALRIIAQERDFIKD